MTSLTESELLQGATAYSSRHEGNQVSERSSLEADILLAQMRS